MKRNWTKKDKTLNRQRGQKGDFHFKKVALLVIDKFVINYLDFIFGSQNLLHKTKLFFSKVHLILLTEFGGFA